MENPHAGVLGPRSGVERGVQIYGGHPQFRATD